ncbi:MAG: hypothetical protein UR25_C0001G0110 [Candidatus Nomurabacteria bacterium GW2011_GWE1_32_28]|uniref:Agmatinase n=1 Tax=Candidatus Nomurabacteria bacterium GW2011_GWF1_31_48 TaxID=1618767 RepID=A0A0F9YGG5_9BACT|nr:MAG: hypothetical protein UR10_C0001G0063 [Candidatus Nomurabacteria bacterium GW2011_GWF2_30_133]KKP28941.1 MAG: hypothetical protein UR18_C0001G0062 [Candidatus Nomurabacteria bacterium GW2011_GWE2_31_40]KKP30679.1 MAG: hypothetical protein UR19_C0001G0063 [Candidatus Nomurabacteria bacterium GW2011_GWF1_31_48]KKP35197.1 MAG: hypothetical protein UR25_C0001G0110 [Candidatus Nomurabacteria bacterium GW2011_GWE1_32_28]HAS80507.1 agmatinase [Candidatus Nomurabacteria bacterium]
MIDKIINTKNVDEADLVILSAPYEHSVSFLGGTAKGPNKIIECLDNYLELFDIDLKCEPAKKIKTAKKEISGLKNIGGKEASKKISTQYEKIYNDHKFIIMLGGEHTVSYGALEAISKKENPKEITILQIDAHQDLRDDSSDYSNKKDKFAHSCVMRRVHELGFPIVQVGIRTYSKYEYEYWQNNKNTITVFGCDGKETPINKILESIKTKKVYITLDVDGFDPSFMPGTGTPVQGGLDWHYGLDLITQIINTKNLIAADIVEVSPQKESALTEFGAALICYKIMAHKFKNKLIS